MCDKLANVMTKKYCQKVEEKVNWHTSLFFFFTFFLCWSLNMPHRANIIFPLFPSWHTRCGLLAWEARCGNHLHRKNLRPIFGNHPGDHIVSVSLRVNDMPMLCKCSSLFLIAVFEGAHLMFLPHLAIKKNKMSIRNISTFIPVNNYYET